MELPITFGIEVEFEAGDRAAITADLRRAHLFGWRIKVDNSCGHELVTPILGSYEDFDKLNAALDILKKHGAKVTPRCGLHVHYGMQTFSFDEVRRVLAFFVRHENAMFNLVDPSRRENRYCTRVTCRDVVKLGSDAWTTDDDRRTWINGQAHRRHNTVELRLLQGTMDLDTIRGWTFLGLSMVNAVKTKNVRVKGSVNGSSALSALLVACGCYRLKGKDPEVFQIVAKDWALSAYAPDGDYTDTEDRASEETADVASEAEEVRTCQDVRMVVSEETEEVSVESAMEVGVESVTAYFGFTDSRFMTNSALTTNSPLTRAYDLTSTNAWCTSP